MEGGRGGGGMDRREMYLLPHNKLYEWVVVLAIVRVRSGREKLSVPKV